MFLSLYQLSIHTHQELGYNYKYSLSLIIFEVFCRFFLLFQYSYKKKCFYTTHKKINRQQQIKFPHLPNLNKRFQQNSF